MSIEEAKKELEKFVRLKTTLRPLFVDVILQALEAERRWANDSIETMAAREQKAYNEGYAKGKAEAEPIKHGRWERYGAITQGTHIIPIYRCSECKEDTNNWFRHYCPNCGATMDEVES